jgi:hypothetical protein
MTNTRAASIQEMIAKFEHRLMLIGHPINRAELYETDMLHGDLVKLRAALDCQHTGQHEMLERAGYSRCADCKAELRIPGR